MGGMGGFNHVPLNLNMRTYIRGNYVVKACKSKNLLSTDKSCLAETGYKPTFNNILIVAAGAEMVFLLANETCQAAFSC